ncbi:hypothetical protein [Methylobacterium sp. J-070]|uniref:hypothetical protein n=1 Tax=Methylobacterium sp. J-070 TaxID=2836650 RepID=UPI001FBAE38A|nr:hypothetical protein [Methylobacterium sp. J-070]MCJ2050315.1 hypothetical protein [Methylobacterium sp. J-070]
MIRPHAIEALAEQRDRLTALLRQMDDGRWWSSGKACRLEEAEVCVQVERIRSALDVVTRLAGELELEDGIGAGSQLAPAMSHPSKLPSPQAPGSSALPEELGPFSPGRVVPHRETHASGGYERRAWDLSGVTTKLT